MPRHSDLNEIGGTGLKLSKLSFGTAPIAGLYTEAPEEESVATILAARELGINYFDCAPLYGVGLAEHRLGLAIAEVESPWVISTKVGRLVRPGANLDLKKWPTANPNLTVEMDHTPSGIRKSLEESLSRLGTKEVQILYMHDCDDWVDDAIEIVYPILNKLRDEGVIKAIGVGLNSPGPACELIKKIDLDLVLIAGRYTLLDQVAQEELLPLAMQRGVRMVAAGVYNSGILANPIEGAFYDYEIAPKETVMRAQEIEKISLSYGVPLKAAAIQFPLRHPAVASVLVGIGNKKQLTENIEVFDIDIPEELWLGLEQKGFIKPVIV